MKVQYFTQLIVTNDFSIFVLSTRFYISFKFQKQQKQKILNK